MNVTCLSVMTNLNFVNVAVLCQGYCSGSSPQENCLPVKSDDVTLRKSADIEVFIKDKSNTHSCDLKIQGGSNMTGTNCDLFTHKSSRSCLNHLV
jgi:hypothetical protein